MPTADRTRLIYISAAYFGLTGIRNLMCELLDQMSVIFAAHFTHYYVLIDRLTGYCANTRIITLLAGNCVIDTLPDNLSLHRCSLPWHHKA